MAGGIDELGRRYADYWAIHAVAALLAVLFVVGVHICCEYDNHCSAKLVAANSASWADGNVDRREPLTVTCGCGTIRWPSRTTRGAGLSPRTAVHRCRVPCNSSRSFDRKVAERIGSLGERVSQIRR